MITLYLKQFNKIIRNTDLKIFDTLNVEDVLWIDMLDPSFKEQRIVETFMDISLQTRQQIEEIETSSKYSESAKSVVSNANFFIPKSEEDFTIEPVSFIVSRTQALISVHTHEMRTFRDAERRLQVTPKNYPTGFHIFASLLEVRVDYDADLVEATAKAVAALSRDIAREDNIDKEFIRRIGRLQENTMVLRENIFDRQRVLWMIRRSERFPRDISPRVQLMIKDVNSLISYADFTFQRLDYIQDSALGLINIEQNEIVKIFSVASVIFMPATLIASVYGMNFKFMPELSWSYTMESGYVIPVGYIFAVCLMLLCSALTIWFFRFKKWL